MISRDNDIQTIIGRLSNLVPLTEKEQAEKEVVEISINSFKQRVLRDSKNNLSYRFKNHGFKNCPKITISNRKVYEDALRTHLKFPELNSSLVSPWKISNESILNKSFPKSFKTNLNDFGRDLGVAQPIETEPTPEPKLAQRNFSLKTGLIIIIFFIAISSGTKTYKL